MQIKSSGSPAPEQPAVDDDTKHAGSPVPFKRRTSSNSSYRSTKSLSERQSEVTGVRIKFPSKIPIIVERYYKEKQLPGLDKEKFLVPKDITLSQFQSIIRSRLNLKSTQSIYLMIDGKNLASLSFTLGEIYRNSGDEDGFLYITYASQEMFG